MKTLKATIWTSAVLLGLCGLVAMPATADHVINDDCIIVGSMCVGVDCVNGESFGFDTLRLKENNTRIDFTDTSSTSSFPTGDWTIVANDSSNGGRNAFYVNADAGNSDTGTKFLIEGDSQDNAIYATSNRVGFGTNSPSVELHVVDGDSPTLRLEQDGSSGFAPQTWDLSGNEANFFVRDVTTGSRLPFRTRPGAPTSSIDVAASGNVGIGTGSPAAPMHIRRTTTGFATEGLLKVESTADEQTRIRVENDGAQQTGMVFGNSVVDWSFVNNGAGNFIANSVGTGLGNELTIDGVSGNVTILGSLIAQGGDGVTDPGDTFPDYVFEDNYPLMPISELAAFVEKERHLPNVFSVDDIRAAKGINMTKLQLQILEKVEELVLYTIEQQDTILEQQTTIEALHQRLNALEGSQE